jgi:pyrimidine-specific ribonucleoside hydrolase
MPHKLILDTDIGGDPDDALALVLALRSPEIELELVITSDEHREHRASFATELLRELGSEVEVLSGTDLGNDRCCLMEGSPRFKTFSRDPVQRMYEVIASSTSCLWYACIGPQSNLDLLLTRFPDITPNIKVLIMGGAFSGRSEHNIRYDEKAAERILASPVEKFYVPLEITTNEALKLNEHHLFYRALKSKGWQSLVKKNFDLFFEKLYPESSLHDPFTLSYLIDPDILEFRKVGLEFSGGNFKESESGSAAYLCEHANYARFISLLGNRLFPNEAHWRGIS